MRNIIFILPFGRLNTGQFPHWKWQCMRTFTVICWSLRAGKRLPDFYGNHACKLWVAVANSTRIVLHRAFIVACKTLYCVNITINMVTAGACKPTHTCYKPHLSLLLLQIYFLCSYTQQQVYNTNILRRNRQWFINHGWFLHDARFAAVSFFFFSKD